MIAAALTAEGPIATLRGPLRIWPPAESTSELNHTVRPSYWAPWTSM